MEVFVVIVRAIGTFIARVAQAFGFTIRPRRPAPADCNDAGAAPCGSNPRICGTSEAAVYGPTGALAEYPGCGTGPRTQVKTQGGIRGLDSAARAELRFAAAPVVTIQVAHFSNPARIEAFQGPAVVDMRLMNATPSVIQDFTLNGTAIDRIVITPASPSDVTLIVGWCH